MLFIIKLSVICWANISDCLTIVIRSMCVHLSLSGLRYNLESAEKKKKGIFISKEIQCRSSQIYQRTHHTNGYLNCYRH